MRRVRTTFAAATITLLALGTSPARAEGLAPLEGLAAELARLRSEIEALDQALDEKKETQRHQLRALAAQKLNLEAEVQREELRTKQLAEELERVRARIRAAGAQQAELKPAVLAAIERMKATVEVSLPFRAADRRGELERLARELEGDTVLPSVALSRLWGWVEDEVRLSRENGLYQQVISLDGREVLAEVARLGMVMLYFRAPDGRYGAAREAGGRWRFEAFTARDDAERTQRLFDALEKRVRVGWFVLPDAIPAAALSQGAHP